jgi:hypothetical protein
VTIWWAVGIVVCVLAIVVAIRAAQNQTGPQAATTKPASTPTGRDTGSDGPTGSAKPAPAVPSDVAGTWAGQVNQTSSAGTFTVSVQMTLVSGASGGTIHYSYSGTAAASFTCSDELTLVSDLASTLLLDQSVIKGPCQAGKVTIIPGTGKTLQFSFEGQGAPPATGTLNKQ